MTDAARIRELMLINLFAVFNERDAERRSKASGYDVALVRDGRIAVLYTLVNAGA